MTWNDQPMPPEAQPSPVRRTLLTAILGASLLVAGGAAVVAAASPDPSRSPAPAASDDSSTSGATDPSRARAQHDGPCPDGRSGSDGSDGSSGSDDGGTADPSPSTTTPAT